MNRYIDCTITRGEACDIDCIVQFQADMAMESEGCLLDREKVAKGVAAAMLDESKGVYWVAKFDGKTIGSLMHTREWSDWNNEWYWWIQSVYVIPEFRRKGVYKAMYLKVKDAAKGSNVSQIRLYADRSNLSAQKVYKSLGMHESHYLMFEENLND